VWFGRGKVGFVDGRIGRGDEGEVVGHVERGRRGLRSKAVICRAKCRIYGADIPLSGIRDRTIVKR